ncbi:MAG TPA: hypothetical protein ENO21_04585, partial [Firmicutes bacterium]|nr:hypothetical protein [Bacillota bacterium]
MAVAMTYALLGWLLAPLGVLAQEPVSELELRQAVDAGELAGAAADWAEETPVPGEPVKFRLRGASLSRILDNPGEFELTVAGVPVPAAVVMPEPRIEPQQIQLTLIAETGPEEPD